MYRNGEAVGKPVRLSGDVTIDGKNAVEPYDARALLNLLTDFLSWQPIIPKRVEDLADLLAPPSRKLRDDVTEALVDSQSHRLCTFGQ